MWKCEKIRIDAGTEAFKLYNPAEFVVFGDLEGVDVMRAIKDRKEQ